jgi:Zn-dependent oligopeptidase
MAKLSKQVKDYMWSKVHERMDAVLSPLNEQVKAEEQHIEETISMAREKANELFQSILKAEFPEQWKELEEKCTRDYYTRLPRATASDTHMIHSLARPERDKKKKEMEEHVNKFMNELFMDVELGAVKKDEILNALSKMELG